VNVLLNQDFIINDGLSTLMLKAINAVGMDIQDE